MSLHYLLIQEIVADLFLNKSFPINQKEVEIPEKVRKNFQTYKNKSYIETIHAIYSTGIATPSFTEILDKHNI